MTFIEEDYLKTAKDAELTPEDTIPNLLPWKCKLPNKVNINAASEMDLRGGILSICGSV